jgi:Tol biopolymer transport system component
MNGKMSAKSAALLVFLGFTGTAARGYITLGEAKRTIHNGEVVSVLTVAYSPDGRVLATGGSDGTINLWDVATGRRSRTLSGHMGRVKGIAFSPDGRTLASGSWDKTVRLWDLATGRELRMFTGAEKLVNSVAFSPDGRTLASASWDGTVRLWDARSGRQKRQLGELSGLQVNVVAFSPDGRLLVSGSADGMARLWDVKTGRLRSTWKASPSGVENAVFSPDGRTLATARGTYMAVGLWDVRKGVEKLVLQGHQAEVSALAFSPDGRTVASGSGDKTIRLWDARSGRAERVWNDGSWISAVAFSPDGRTLAAAGALDNTVHLYSMAEEVADAPPSQDRAASEQNEPVVMNLVVDDSSLEMRPGWALGSAYYLPSLRLQALHAFDGGAVHVEIARWPLKLTPEESARKLKRVQAWAAPSAISTRLLQNGIKFHYLTSIQPIGRLGARHNVLDGFFADGEKNYYVSAIAEERLVSDKQFISALPGIFDVLGTWKSARKKTAPDEAQPPSDDRSRVRKLYLSGVSSLQRGDTEQARRAWTEAARLAPSDPDIKAALDRVNR